MNDNDLQMLRNPESSERVLIENTNTVSLENKENKLHNFFKNTLDIDLFKVWSVIKIVLLSFLIYFTSNILSILIFSPFNENLYTIFGLYVSTIFIILLVYFSDKNIKDTCKLNKINLKLGLKCVPIAIFLLISSTFYFLALDKLGFDLLLSLSSTIQTNSIRVESIFGILTIALIAPISEEFLARGFLLTKLRTVVNIKTAIIIQAIFFALLHGSAIRFIDTFIFGIVMGCFCYYTNSILPGIIMHIANNAFNNFNGLVFPKFSNIGQVLVACTYIILSIIGAYLLWSTLKSFKRNAKQNI